MNKTEAISLLNTLKNNPSLSIDEAIQGYQLSLALCDHRLAIYFEEIHEALIPEYFLDIALNIEKPENQEKLINDSKVWKEALYYELQVILIVIMLSKRDQVTKWDNLLKVFNDENNKFVTVEKIKKTELMQMSTAKLLKHYFIKIKVSESHKRSRKLSHIGSYTKNIKLAKETLTYIRDDRKDLKETIIENINKLSSNENINNSTNRVKSIVSYENSAPDTKLIVDGLDKALEVGILSEEDYDQKILEIAFDIWETHPIAAHNLLEKLHSGYLESLDLQIKISLLLFIVDIALGVEYLKKIEVEFYRFSTISDIVEAGYNSEALKAIFESIEDIFPEPLARYEPMYELNKKIPIGFNDFFKISSELMPYGHLNFDFTDETSYYIDKYGLENKEELKIVHIGIGGAGVNALNSFIANEHSDTTIKTVAIDDNNESLDESLADVKVKLKREETEVLDAKRELEIIKLFRDD